MTCLAFIASLALFIQPEPRNPDADALKGPAIPICKAKSLVEHDFEGALRKLDCPVEEAALELLSLSDTERFAAQSEIEDRAAGMSRIVGENLDLLLKFKLARDAGNTEETRRYLREFHSKLEPVRRDGSLEDRLVAVLSEEHALELKRLTREYRDAVIDDMMARQGQDAKRPRAALAASLTELGLEIKRAYESRIAGGQRELEELIARLQLNATQEAEIRRLVTEFVQATLGRPTASQRIRLFQDMNKHLTSDQRSHLIREIYATPADRNPPDSE